MNVQSNTQKLEPTKVQLYKKEGKPFEFVQKGWLNEKGEQVKFAMPQAFKLIFDGVNISSNTLFDPVIMKQWGKLPEAVQKELIASWLLTSTLIVKNQDGKKLGGEIVFSDGVCSVKFIVNKAFQNEYGLVADLMKGNFNLELSPDGKHATISELREEDARLVKLVSSNSWVRNKANGSTLFVPAESVFNGTEYVGIDEAPDGVNTKNRYSKFPSGPLAALGARGLISVRFVHVDLPSGGFGVPENTEKLTIQTEKETKQQPGQKIKVVSNDLKSEVGKLLGEMQDSVNNYVKQINDLLGKQ